MSHKLLLADDSITIQRVIELTFADEDVRVIAVGDGKQAIAKIKAEQPDIVLADVGMPEHDGYDVAAFVKATPELAHVPVLLLTGAFEPVDEARARAAGCAGVLVKPFEPQMVINRVKDLLAGRRPAGLWALPAQAQAAGAAQPVNGQEALDAQPESVAPNGDGGALEDYFDRLDAAFAGIDTAGGPQAAGAAVTVPIHGPNGPGADGGRNGGGQDPDVLANWDPDLNAVPGAPDAAMPAYDVQAPPPSAPVMTAPSVILPPPDAAEDAVPAEPAGLAAAPVSDAAAMEESAGARARAAAAVHTASLAQAFAALLSAEQEQGFAAAAIRPSDVTESTIEEIVRRVIDRISGESVRGVVVEIAERLVREEIARLRDASSSQS